MSVLQKMDTNLFSWCGKNSSNHCVKKNDLPKLTVEFVSQLDFVEYDAHKKDRNSPKIFNYDF